MPFQHGHLLRDARPVEHPGQLVGQLLDVVALDGAEAWLSNPRRR